MKRLAAAFADPFHREGAAAPFALDRDFRFLEADDLEGGAEQLPRQPAKLAGEDLRELLDLPVSRRRVHYEDGLAIPVVNGLRPLDQGGALHP